MKREYVAVLEGGEPSRDEIVDSCTASSRHEAEQKINKSGLYVVMTLRQAKARDIQDFRVADRFCR